MRWLAFNLVLYAVTCCLAQPPPNDDFTNRITLTGSSFTLTADTSGATFDYYNEPGYNQHYNYYGSAWGAPSLWWSWTPTQSGPVVIERTDSSPDGWGYLAVYATPNLTWDSVYDQVAGIFIPLHGQFAVFEAQAGTEYQISVASHDPAPMHFRFTSTNAPVFRVQPQTQTVSSGQSVLFTASAVGLTAVLYQWQKNGANLPNCTNHCLTIHNITFDDAGDYTMLAVSVTGTSTSRVAQLIVRTNELRPTLYVEKLSEGNNFEFTVSGEIGCVYRCEQSSDLVNWSGPLIFNTNAVNAFHIAKDAPSKLVRLSRYQPANEICNCNLKQIWFAMRQCAEDRHALSARSYGTWDIAPYCMNGQYPKCPLDVGLPPYFSYVTTTDVAHPTCIWSPYTHVLEEDWFTPFPRAPW